MIFRKNKTNKGAARAKDADVTSQKKPSTFQKLKTFLSIVTTLFFIGNSLYWVFNKWGNFGGLLWVMLAVTVLYILVFAISLIKHRNDSEQMSMDNKKFKLRIKFWRTLSNLLFIAMSGLTLAQSLMELQNNGDIFVSISMWVSGVVIFFKLVSTIFKLAKLNKRRKKLNKKQQKLNAKQ